MEPIHCRLLLVRILSKVISWIFLQREAIWPPCLQIKGQYGGVASAPSVSHTQCFKTWTKTKDSVRHGDLSFLFHTSYYFDSRYLIWSCTVCFWHFAISLLHSHRVQSFFCSHFKILHQLFICLMENAAGLALCALSVFCASTLCSER